MIRKEDSLWKGLLEGVFEDFIRFMHPGIAVILDLTRKPEFLDKELEQVFPPENEQFSPKVVDKLVKVFTHEGKEEWILLHIEIQGRYHKDFGKRMFTYFYRILDKYNKRISAYAIFTEETAKHRPECYALEFMGTSMRYRFNTYKIAAATDEELLKDENPFAIVVLAARAIFKGRQIKNSKDRDQLLMELKFGLAKELELRNIEPQKAITIMNFLRYYIRFEDKNLNIEFDKKIEILTNKKRTMGIEEQLLEIARKKGEFIGERKGERKGQKNAHKQIIQNLIHNLGYSEEKIAEIIAIPLSAVKKYTKSLRYSAK